MPWGPAAPTIAGREEVLLMLTSSLTSHEVLFAFQQHWKHSEVKNTLWHHYKRLHRGIMLYKVHCLCRWKAIFGDQCLLVTVNIKEFFSVERPNYMGSISGLRQDTTSVASRNRAKGQYLDLKLTQHPWLKDTSTSTLPSTYRNFQSVDC